MLTRDSTRHFESFHYKSTTDVFGVASGPNAVVASGEEREAGLRPSFLSPSLLNHLSPQTPVHNTPNSSVWRSPSKVQFQFQLHSPHITLKDASDDRKARWERKKTLLLRPSPISSCCSYSMSFHFVTSIPGVQKKKIRQYAKRGGGQNLETRAGLEPEE